MDKQQKTWTSEEAIGNLESLTRLEWDRGQLPEGAKELLDTYEAAIPQLAAEIRHLREELLDKLREEKRQDQPPAGENTRDEGPRTSSGYEDLTDFARRLGLDQR